MSDAAAKRELDLHLENTSSLHNQKTSIIANVKRRMKSGKYDPKLAPKLWLYWVDAGAKSYVKELGGSVQAQFPKKLREELAADLARQYAASIRGGEYGSISGLGAAPKKAKKVKAKKAKKSSGPLTIRTKSLTVKTISRGAGLNGFGWAR